MPQGCNPHIKEEITNRMEGSLASRIMSASIKDHTLVKEIEMNTVLQPDPAPQSRPLTIGDFTG